MEGTVLLHVDAGQATPAGECLGGQPRKQRMKGGQMGNVAESRLTWRSFHACSGWLAGWDLWL
jgi:hypothetical protein